jgi:hypothetical protein
MAKYQVIDAKTGRKENVIEWDGKTPFALPGKTIKPDDGSPIWAPVPAEVSPVQARKALRRAGLIDAVNTHIATLGGDDQDTWEYADSIHRDNPILAAVASSLSLSETQLDDLFRLAATL